MHDWPQHVAQATRLEVDGLSAACQQRRQESKSTESEEEFKVCMRCVLAVSSMSYVFMKKYTFRRSFNEKPGNIPGCPLHVVNNTIARNIAALCATDWEHV